MVDQSSPTLTSDLYHLAALDRVSLFTSQGRRPPKGRLIAENLEEIELIVGGKAQFNLDGQRFAVETGSMLWHQGGEETVYDTDPDDPYRCLVIAFRVRGRPHQRPPRLSAWRSAAAAVAFGEDLLATFHRGDVDRQLLCNYAYTTCQWQAHVAGPSRINPVLPSALRRALHIIAQNFADDLDLPTIARQAGLSVPHLHALFRHYLTSTPSKSLEERRLRHARWLLAESADPVASIAMSCGFRDATSFCRVFKRRQGMTPGAYRARYSAPIG